MCVFIDVEADSQDEDLLKVLVERHNEIKGIDDSFIVAELLRKVSAYYYSIEMQNGP